MQFVGEFLALTEGNQIQITYGCQILPAKDVFVPYMHQYSYMHQYIQCKQEEHQKECNGVYKTVRHDVDISKQIHKQDSPNLAKPFDNYPPGLKLQSAGPGMW